MALLVTAVPARADDAVNYRGSVSWLNGYEHTTPLASDLNPANAALQIPGDELESELRPNLKLSTGNLQLVARPRLRYLGEQAKEGGHTETTTGTAHAYANEAFAQWTLSDRITLVMGRQNYQWGAAESLSPTNRLFPDTVQQRDVFYEEEGRDIARANFSFGKQISIVAMGEVQPNQEIAPFVAGQPFQQTAVIKPEINWDDGTNYIGFVAGGRQHGQPWAGEYFNYVLPLGGLSIFADVSHERGSEAWYPVVAPGSVTFAQTRLTQTKLQTMGVGGLKYDFVNGAILRGEYILNQAGYDKTAHDLALTAFRTPTLNPALATSAATQEALAQRTTNTTRFLESGLELPGQHYVYGSLHVPDLFAVKDLNFDTRGLASVRDGSLWTYTQLDYSIGDNGTLTIAETATAGRKDSELRGYNSPTHILAYRQDW